VVRKLQLADRLIFDIEIDGQRACAGCAMNLPVVHCTQHAGEFKKTYQETAEDGTQVLVTQYWKADAAALKLK
jgi:hypothetical protein